MPRGFLQPGCLRGTEDRCFLPSSPRNVGRGLRQFPEGLPVKRKAWLESPTCSVQRPPEQVGERSLPRGQLSGGAGTNASGMVLGVWGRQMEVEKCFWGAVTDGCHCACHPVLAFLVRVSVPVYHTVSALKAVAASARFCVLKM